MRLCRFTTPSGGRLLVNPLQLVQAGEANQELHPGMRFVQAGQDGPEIESSVCIVKDELHEIEYEFTHALEGIECVVLPT